jgi:hypothetical protein
VVPRAVAGELARDAVELAGAADHRQVVWPWVQIAPEADVAEAADLAVQVNDEMALEAIPRLRRVPAFTVEAADPVMAVGGVDKRSLFRKRSGPTCLIVPSFASTVK